jgi:gliding motility-associated-like protein
VFTYANTTYQVTATIGGCSSTGQVHINTVPYPQVNAGSDTVICYNTSAQLHGTTDGSSFQWSPSSSLNNASTSSPVAHPASTTSYVLSAFDTRGCPKPGRDTVLVVVRPKINADAGNDTAVVLNQPLQLNATGGVHYVWSPASYLSATDINNPVAQFDGEAGDIRYHVSVYDDAGCKDTSSIFVHLFKTAPSVFVPSGFTPNNDGLNDVLRPILVGIKSMDYFAIYNRWGRQVFLTTAIGQGWDGKINDQVQPNETFVWVIKGKDYRGVPFLLKGFVTLIR